jgi:hypothetical protein
LTPPYQHRTNKGTWILHRSDGPDYMFLLEGQSRPGWAPCPMPPGFSVFVHQRLGRPHLQGRDGREYPLTGPDRFVDE